MIDIKKKEIQSIKKLIMGISEVKIQPKVFKDPIQENIPKMNKHQNF